MIKWNGLKNIGELLFVLVGILFCYRHFIAGIIICLLSTFIIDYAIKQIVKEGGKGYE